MGGSRLLSIALGAILVLVACTSAQNHGGEHVRMASDHLVIPSYKEVETTSTSSSAVTVSPEDGTEYQIYQGVMGRPGIDFPVYPHIPATDFNCRDIKHSGYYADLSTDCQVFHICDGGRKISFLCPNGTIFRQSHLICDWWFRVDCGKSVELYEESAEQLAVDQKIYKERADEREKRRRLAKGEGRNEFLEPEVYALDEPFDVRNKQYSPLPSSTQSSVSVVTSVRMQEGRRNGERHSKRVLNSRMEEKFPTYSRVGKSDKLFDQPIGEVPRTDGRIITEKVSIVNGRATEVRTFTGLVEPVQVSSTTPQPVFVQKARHSGRNSVISTPGKDSFHEAASGSLVDTLRTSGERQNTPMLVFPEGKPTVQARYTPQVTTSPPARVFAESRQVTTTPRVERERQHFAETASFASNRGGRTFSDFAAQNQFEQLNQYKQTTTRPTSKLVPPTTRFVSPVTRLVTESNTPLLIRVTDAPPKVKRPDEKFKITQSYSTSPAYKATVPVVKATASPKQNSKKVTVSPLSALVAATTQQRQENIHPGQRNATSRIPVENIYFTTTSPETEATVSVAGAQSTPEVVISLQELNIHKAAEAQENETSNSYESVYRDGLEVPPSSGPTALRSFALYFAGSADPADRRGKAIPYLSKDVLIIPITSSIEEKLNRFAGHGKTKEVVQKVDDIVKESKKTTTTEPLVKTSAKLPESLTNQTKESYSALFAQRNVTTNAPPTEMSKRIDFVTEVDYGTTAFEAFTEQPSKINSELSTNDLQRSQTRGLVEPENTGNHLNDQFSRVSPDLRELAQVFTKALSAYLDDPEAFRRVLSEIRPTEPSTPADKVTPAPVDYPSATQEDDEVLDFSDVTKATYRKKSSTTIEFRETTTEYQTEAPTTFSNDIENLVLPLSINLNDTKPISPALELIAPLESLDESQSSYYTPSPSQVGTTNAIAEEINQEFSPEDKLPDIDSNEADTYFPITGSVDDESRPRYGGFQNNSSGTTAKYSPYGAELTTTTRQETTTLLPETTTPFFEEKPTRNSLYDKLKREEALKLETEREIALARELNGLAVPGVHTRGNYRGGKALEHAESTISTKTTQQTRQQTTQTPATVTEFQAVKLGNGETLERTYSRGRARPSPTTARLSENINLELSPPDNTDIPKGFLITYSLEQGRSTQATYLPRSETTTLPAEELTTEITTPNPSTERLTTLQDQAETFLPTTYTLSESKLTKVTKLYSSITSEATTALPSTTTLNPKNATKTGKSLERLMELQESLMFNTSHTTVQQKETARLTVEKTMSNMSMTESTAHTLMKMMEMAAKNETYRRLVLLLVNDKSGKNKTVEEARQSLLKALLTPVIGRSRGRARVYQESLHTESSSSSLDAKRRSNFRRNKSVKNQTTEVPITTFYRRITTASPGKTTSWKTTRPLPRIVKTTEAPSTTTEKPSTVFGSLGFIRKTIEESKTKEIKVNSLDDAILDSDSRAVELLRSLYSLAARWG